MPRKTVDFDAVCEVARKLPGVVEGFIHGVPSFKADGKLLVCPALHKSAEADSIVVRIGIDQRSKLISANPDTYYLTNHYADHPMVLVRLSQLDRMSLQELLQQSWQFTSIKQAASIRRSPPKSAARKKKVNS